MASTSNILNEKNILKYSKSFQENKPFKFGFMENVFEESFYQELYNTYPKFDNSWIRIEEPDKSTYRKFWFDEKKQIIDKSGTDGNFSESWTALHNFVHSEDFSEIFSKFCGVEKLRTKYFTFVNLIQGGFQYPHSHNVSPSTLTMFFYFVKDWQQGDPGCTYFASGEEESDIILEPYNLNNSMTIFLDSPNAWHGVRYIPKKIERHSLCIIMEKYSEELGWDSENQNKS